MPRWSSVFRICERFRMLLIVNTRQGRQATTGIQWSWFESGNKVLNENFSLCLVCLWQSSVSRNFEGLCMLMVNTKQGRLRRSTCYKDPRDLVWPWKKNIQEDFKFWHCLCWTIQDLWRIAYAYCKHKAKSGLRRPRPKGLGDQFILTQPLFVVGSQTVFNSNWFYNTVRMGFWLLAAEFTDSISLWY